MTGVDVEALAVNALLDDAGVVALCSDRVYVDLPPNPRFPLVLVTRTGGTTDSVGHLDSSLLQIEGWAKDRGTARDLTAEALRVILEARGIYTEGIVTGARPFTGIGYLPDPPTATPRYLFRIVLFAHPIPVSA